jgi:hypothetical protein
MIYRQSRAGFMSMPVIVPVGLNRSFLTTLITLPYACDLPPRRPLHNLSEEG